MNVSRHVRTGGALGHLLLVVVLALGVFVMHTVGHPGDSAAAGMSGASHASTSTMDAAPSGHEPAMALASTDTATPAAALDHPSSPHMPGAAMDMMSLCLAVLLGAWVLAALLRSALSRRPDWLANLLAQAPVLLRPNPPPRGPDLTQLSVLRL
ncbi:hypothetical protein ACFY30_30330 [Streptomyces sp. NPDC000345]|uniref:hypothetical protein n=1 Tax=Streptomyces sp. NPDC000345 TaxID=3364537 RepID=UPI00367B4A8C